MPERHSERIKLTSKQKKSRILVRDVDIYAVLTVADGWTVTMEAGRFRFTHEPRKDARPLHMSSYIARQNFLAIETPEDGFRFFKRFGPLSVPGSEDVPGLVPNTAQAPDVTLSQIKRLQRTYEAAMTASSADWNRPRRIDLETGENADELRRFLALNCYRSPALTISIDNPPRLLAHSSYVTAAIVATIYLDKVRQAKALRCAECGKIALAPNAHYRRFCSIKCGNRASKRKYNDKLSGKLSKERG